MIWFLAVLYPPFEYDETSLEANIRGQRFIAKGRIVKGQGWKAAYDTAVDDGEEEDEPEVKDQQLPDLKKGDYLLLPDASGKIRMGEEQLEGIILKTGEKVRLSIGEMTEEERRMLVLGGMINYYRSIR